MKSISYSEFEQIQSGMKPYSELADCQCATIRKYAESLIHCPHTLCSISEAINEERLGEEILKMLHGKEEV